jgi:hypothetical protein
MQAQKHVVAHLQPFHKVNSWKKNKGVEEGIMCSKNKS